MTEKPLFTFGTLMDRDLLALVSGMDLSDLYIEAAFVNGYCQLEVIDQQFPVLLPQADTVGEGVLIRHLSLAAMNRILFYEGDEYCLIPIEVTTEHGIEGAQYFRSTNMYGTLDSAWSFTDWLRDHKTAFLPRVATFMQLYGTMSTAEADQYW